MVPKKSSRPSEVAEHSWRMSFPIQERALLDRGDRNALKPLIKLLKRLRDKNQTLSGLSSYSLKITAVHLSESRAGATMDWGEGNLPGLLLAALIKLRDFVDPDKL